MSPFHWVRDPAVLFRAVHEFRGTLSWMPNFAFNHCVKSIRERDLEALDLTSWRSVSNGGEPVRRDSMQMFAERFRPFGFDEQALKTAYGMAENVQSATLCRHDQTPRVEWIKLEELQHHGRATPATDESPGAIPLLSCGTPLRGTKVRIVDEQGRTVPERCVGEIVLRSPYMLSGYWNRPDLTAQAVRHGWFHTGDLGYLADDQLFVTGRKKDLIIAMGRNLYPQDLEAIASTVSGIHPGRVVAFGVTDPEWGTERIVMVFELRDHTEANTEERIQIERELRRRITQELDVTLGDVRLVERGWVLKTSNGKLARAANREKYLLEFGNRTGVS
jgi:acyl-CoA synthetase (AMP-forming)/AMP-acid ligase II